MPSNITHPLTTGSVDRLSVTITSPRGEVDPSNYSMGPTYCFESE